MSGRITGQQARELLEDTTPGQWETGPGMDFMRCRVVFDRRPSIDIEGATVSQVLADVARPGDADLIAAAPELAETIAWLYGREPDIRNGAEASHWGLGDGFTAYRIGRMVTIGDADKHIVFTPEEAVEAARILLTAAEEAKS